MPGAVAGQRLGKPAQHQIAVGLQHHVDEVDDDDAADVAEPQLANDLLGGLDVVLGDGLLEVAARPGELAGVDVHDRHGLGAVDDQCAARGQPHLAVHRFGQLLVDAMYREDIRSVRVLVLGELRKQFRRNRIDVSGDGVPGVVAGDDQPGEVLVEQVPDDLDQNVGLFIEGYRGAGLLRLGLLGVLGDLGPPLLQSVDVGADIVFLHTLGRGADDHPGVGGNHLAQDVLESLAFGVGKLATDTGRGCPGDVHQIAAGQRHLGCEPGALVADRVLADLHDDVVAGLEGLLDLAVGSTQTGGLPVDLAGVEHAVAAAADVDEGRLHRGQHILDDAEVDVAHQGGRRRRGDEVLDDDAVLHDGDLGVAGTLVRRFGADLVPHHHHSVHRFAASQEFRFGQDRRSAASGVAAIPAALPLGFKPGGSADALDLVGVRSVRLGSGSTLVNHGVRRVVGSGRVGVLTSPCPATTATATATGGTLAARRFVVTGFVVGLRALGVFAVLGGLLGDVGGVGGVVGVLAGLLTAAAAAATAAAAAAAIRRAVALSVGGLHRVRVLAVLALVVGLGECRGDDRLGSHEERHVGRWLNDRGGVGRLQDQPRLRLILLVADNHHRAFGGQVHRGGRCRRHDLRIGRGKHFADSEGLGLVDAGLRAAGAAVELGQRFDDAPAGRAQHAGEFMDPQALGQIHRCRRRLPRRRGLVQVLVVIIIGHLVSSSPRARLTTRPREGFRYVPGGCRTFFTDLVMGLAPRGSGEPPGVWLNDGCGRSAPHRDLRWSRTSEVSFRWPVSEPPASSITHRRTPPDGPGQLSSAAGKPEGDLAGRRLRRIRAMHQVELGLQTQVAADGARSGLLDRVGATGQLPKRRDSTRPFEDRGNDGPGGDELQQIAEERLVLVLGVVSRGEVVAHVLEFQRRHSEALALDTADDLPDHPALHAVGFDQHQGLLGHLPPFLLIAWLRTVPGADTSGRVPVSPSAAVVRVTARAAAGAGLRHGSRR